MVLNYIENNVPPDAPERKALLDTAKLMLWLEPGLAATGLEAQRSAALHAVKTSCMLDALCVACGVQPPARSQDLARRMVRPFLDMDAPGAVQAIEAMRTLPSEIELHDRRFRAVVSQLEPHLGLFGCEHEADLRWAIKDFIPVARWYLQADPPPFGAAIAKERRPPPRQARVLIVDDLIGAVSSSWRALAGWPGLEVDAYLLEEFQGSGDIEDYVQSATAGIIGCIRDSRPDIVLMDQGLGLLDGSDVVLAYRRRFPKQLPVFAANTGGSPEELNRAGAYGNFAKGRDPFTLEECLPMIKRLAYGEPPEATA